MDAIVFIYIVGICNSETVSQPVALSLQRNDSSSTAQPTD